jgi:serine/threonine-protein kinase RsbW
MASDITEYKSIVLPSVVATVSTACRDILSEVKAFGFDDEATFGIHLALEEAAVNAVKHGNGRDSAKNVTVKYLVTEEKFDICIADDGPGFDPEGVADPRARENLCKTGGRGVLLMKTYMDFVEYNACGNCVHMIKFKSSVKG